ncbi:unnamed protein product [Rotaria sordida]|uniref:NAD(+) kinase n=1 Tax=Rotaria sordida TaxID=392033 RepID=A0A813UMF9_9BILA|nr:unnamed protein product [Rotaria sordida]
MNQGSKHDIFTSSHQRRAQNANENVPPVLDHESNESGVSHNNETLNNSNREVMKESEDDCVLPPLPKISRRPKLGATGRTHSVFAPSPRCNFGPKGTLKKIQNDEELIVIQDPSSQRLHWNAPPSNILIIRKPGLSTLPEFQILVVKLLKRRLNVFVASSDRAQVPFDSDADLKESFERCIPFDQKNDLNKIDLVICLGGDGTLLHASSVFQKNCPPVLSFSMGSLGFLTPFDFQFHDKILDEALSGKVAVLLRTRLKCTIIKGGLNNLSPSDTPDLSSQTSETSTSSDVDDALNLALNEVVIDRGPNPYLSNIDLYINDKFITKVQGDGLIISTPTGSTAYGMAAGASMVHPSVPAMVLCPICPHSLSFRPIVVPAGIDLTVKVAEDARLTAWLSVDGRNRLELLQNDSVKMTTSIHPVPCICRFDQVGDWFQSLADILHWNIRKPQLSFDTKKKTERPEEIPTQGEEQVKTQDGNE